MSMKLSSAIGRNKSILSNIQNAHSFAEVQDGALSSAAKIVDRAAELKALSLDVVKVQVTEKITVPSFNHFKTSCMRSRKRHLTPLHCSLLKVVRFLAQIQLMSLSSHPTEEVPVL